MPLGSDTRPNDRHQPPQQLNHPAFPEALILERMEYMGRPKRCSVEVGERAVRMVSARRGEYGFGWAAICSIVAKFGWWAETLREWVRRSERDEGLRPGFSSERLVEFTELRREVRELRRADEMLGKASACFAEAGCSIVYRGGDFFRGRAPWGRACSVLSC